MQSPVGPLTIVVENDAVVALDWVKPLRDDDHPVLVAALDQLSEYFDGKRQDFDLPFAPQVSDFQKIFGQALCDIPYGETRTYGDLAKQLDRPAQAIGQACGANPIAILIPCHRVLSSTGLGGYSGAGGVETKVKLLQLEGAGSLLL
ncbi:MAG: methylated-DNA--[protein]-cysteine S-methyltransferase [Yoonia sp.]|uniref:methylated-DNA--[protein]-cysteine S-methyltransferase n=1 Tax=Yoonia sp. TaxID=2212373 RepID=UPI003263E58A